MRNPSSICSLFKFDIGFTMFTAIAIFPFEKLLHNIGLALLLFS